MLAYIGPDQLMPLASIVGAVTGGVLIFWRSLVGTVKRVFGAFRRAK